MAPRKPKQVDLTAEEYKAQQAELNKLLTTEGIRLQIIAAIKSNTTDVGNLLIEIDKKALVVANSFGVGRDNIVNIKAALASARDGVIDLGGSYDDLVSQQVEASKAVGRNVLLTAEAQKDLYAASQVTNQSVTDMVGKMKDVGISAFDAGKRMGDVVNAARQAGVSAEVVSGLVLKNTDALNRYNFRDGVEGLSKMAAQAVSMRFDMAETFKIAEKAFSPEGAIKMSAELQRLGVTQSALLDPLYLMNLAENDPAELQNQITDLSKSFVELNEKGQFQIMPGSGRRLRAIAESLGVSYSEMSKMAIASRELEDKMQRISLPDNLFKDEEQKNLFRGMFEMKDGEYKIQLGTKELGIQDAIKELEKTPGLLEKTLADSKPKTMEELAKEQLGYLELIATGINALKGRVPAALSAVPEAEQLLSGFSKLGKAVPEKISDAIFGSTKDLAEGLQPKMKQIGEKFGDIFKIPDSYKDAKENLNKLGDFLKDLGKSALESTKDVYGKGKEKTKETIKELGEWLGPEFLADWESMTGGDTLIRPDTKQIIQLDPNDAVYATKNPVFPSSLMEQVPKIERPKETLTIPNIPQTKIETNEGQSKLDVDMKLQIPNLPPNIDTAQLMSILNSTFKDQNFIEKLIQEIARIKTNNNLTPMRK